MFISPFLASSSCPITNISIPDDMVEKIKSITERFEEISKDREALHLKEEDWTQVVTVGRQIRPPTSSHVDERTIFGRKVEKEEIINRLNPSNGPNFMVLPIVGMGGLGKTTLAQLVYNDFRFNKLFDKRVWVSVSEDFDLVHLTRATIESISDSRPCNFSELSKLQDVLNEEIRGIRVFLVLDDVWNETRNLWERFQVAFHGAKTVRILATTRNTSAAEIMQTISYFPLSCLPVKKCWLLFKHFAFDNKDASENANLLKIGRGIVNKCKGLPLTIKVLGGMLRYVMDEGKWREVLECDIPEVDEGSEIMLTLWLSYRKLPLHLRPCLLFLSMYPKGKWFEKKKVVRLWMAQGYINGNAITKKTMEEIGSEYFDELQGRSLVEGWYPNWYRLHDLIHDLATFASQGANQLILEDDQQLNNSHKVHHLYLTKQDELSGSLGTSNYRAIRTFVKICPKSYLVDSAILHNLCCLRALELKDCELPETLSMLKQLRYFSIESYSIGRLPQCLCLLYNLQSLHLYCPNSQELPENIKNLINLRYLCFCSVKIEYLPESVCLLRNLNTLNLCCNKLKTLPRNIEKLTNLCILNSNHYFNIGLPSGIRKLLDLKTVSGRFDVMEDQDMIGGLEELKDMNKLSGFLGISGLENIGNVECTRKANLISKPNLNKLNLDFEGASKRCLSPPEQDSYQDHILHIDVLPSNTADNVNNEIIQEGILESLQPHDNLKELTILNYAGMKFPSWLLHRSSMYEQPTIVSFLSLRAISFIHMPNLVDWEAGDGQFPCLEKLVINDCPKLWKIAVPLHVRELEIKGCGCQVINFFPQSEAQDILILNCTELISIYYKNGDLPVLKNVTLSGCPKLLLFSAIKEELDKEDCGFQEIKFSTESKIRNSLCRDYRELILVSSPIFSDFEELVLFSSTYRRVVLINCPKLRIFSAIPVAVNVLKIRSCGFREIMLPSQCQQLLISDCLDLVSVHESTGDLSPLELVTFTDCPNLQLLQVTKQVKKLQIKSCGIRELTFPSKSNLKILEIEHCPKLPIVQWNDGDMQFLKEIIFEDCPKLQRISVIPNDIFTKCGLHEIQFSIQCQIARAHISSCPELISLHFLEGHSPLLEELSIRSCPGLYGFLTIPNQLKKLKIIDCNFSEIHLLSQSKLWQLSISN